MKWTYALPLAQHNAMFGTDAPRSVYHVDGNMCESCQETREDVVEWVTAGGVIEEPNGINVAPEA